MRIYIFPPGFPLPSILLFGSLCICMSSCLGVCIQAEWSVYSGTVRAPYLPMWDHRGNFRWWLPHVGYLNSSLTSVCNFSIPTYAKQVSYLEGRNCQVSDNSILWNLALSERKCVLKNIWDLLLLSYSYVKVTWNHNNFSRFLGLITAKLNEKNPIM